MFSFTFSSIYCFSSLDTSLTHELFRTALFSFQTFGWMCSFYLSVTDFQFKPIVIGEHILYNFNFFNFLRFVFWCRIWSMLVNILWELEENVYSAAVRSNILWQLDLVGWCIVEFYILANFQSGSPIDCWEKGVEISYCSCGFAYFSFSSISFALQICSSVYCVHI